MKRKALFIGVNEYTDPEIRNLSCSVRDAISMHDIFEELGYQANLLENPGKGDVFHAVRKITSDMAAGDQFLFYFAGHGFTDSGQHLLFCADDIHEHLRFRRAGIPFDLLEMETRKGGYDRAFLLDACQSDFLTGTRGEDVTTRDLVAIGDMVPRSEDASGSFYVLRSCSKFEHALEIESRKHGLFTLAMIDILRQSKNSGTELLFSDSLRETVRAKMYCIAQAEGITARQTPESDGRGAVQVLISGMKPSASSVMVDCPICGRHNRVEETFKCKICGKDHLCARHFSDEGNCCKECAEKIQLKENTQKAIEAYASNDYARAFTLAQKSDQSIAVIQYIIGYGYENGFGCEKNQVEAIKWYRKAQKQGYAGATVCLANLWETTAVNLAKERKNFDEEKFWDEIKRDDDAQSNSEDGRCPSRVFRDELYDDIMRIDWSKALYMISEAEKHVAGVLEAEKQITNAIVNNDESVRNLTEIKVENPYLQFQIGMTYYAHPVAQNKELAARWFEKSAKQKCAPSLYMLGRMYEYGEGVTQNYVKAKKLFDRVGIDKIPMSDVAIAHMYEFGLADAEERDVGAAMEWYEYAVGHGCRAVMALYLRSVRTFYSLHPDRTPKFGIQGAAKGSYESFSMLLCTLQECTKSAVQGNVEDQNKLGGRFRRFLRQFLR